jgi:hypothetical protein
MFLAVGKDMLEFARKQAWHLEVERWRAGVRYMEERHTAKVMWEKQEQLNRLLVSVSRVRVGGL